MLHAKDIRMHNAMIDRDGGKLPARLFLNNGYTGASAEPLTSNDRALARLLRPIHIQYNP